MAIKIFSSHKETIIHYIHLGFFADGCHNERRQDVLDEYEMYNEILLLIAASCEK